MVALSVAEPRVSDAPHRGSQFTLATFAAAKGLSTDFLRDHGVEAYGAGVRFAYLDDAGGHITYKRRTALKAKDGSFWPRGVALAPYGLWRLDRARRVGTLYLVEGETDTLTLWLHDVPALGMPGASSAKCLAAEHLAGIEKLYISREPDQGGATFVDGLLARLRSIGFSGTGFQFTMPPGIKDPSELYVTDPARFPARFGECVRGAVQIWPAAPATGTASDPHLTDRGNATHLVQRHGEDLLYCHPWQKWLAWDGARWRPDDTGEAMRRAKRTIQALYDETAANISRIAEELQQTADLDGKVNLRASLKEAERRLAWALKSEQAPRLEALLSLARSDRPILPANLDTDPYLLNVTNGTLDLRTGTLRPHRREDLATKLCPTPYDSRAECPRFLLALGAIVGGDQELVQFVQRFLGYALTGDVREQVLPIWWGAGANGKSTLLTAILETVGPDYAGTAPVELLTDNRGNQHPTILADLFGKRLLVAAETDQGRRLNESRLKRLTGGDAVKARRMREDWWEFAPTHKLVLVTNHKPEVKGTDHAIWRRLRLVPFTVQFLDHEAPENAGKEIPPHLRIDRHLHEALRAERPGILAWLVRGCAEWLRNGLPSPPAVLAATKQYREDQDVVGEFITTRCVTGADYRVRASDLYGEYKQWFAEERGDERPMSGKAFGGAMTERRFERYTANGTWYRGISLLGQ